VVLTRRGKPVAVLLDVQGLHLEPIGLGSANEFRA
jgi:hypothetical protein